MYYKQVRTVRWKELRFVGTSIHTCATSLACSSLILVVGAGLVRVFAHVEGRAHVLARVRTTNACGFPGFLPLFAARNGTTDDDQQSDDDASLQFHVSRPQE